jgi:hypothetical protein
MVEYIYFLFCQYYEIYFEFTFSHFMCKIHSAIISKVHYEFILCIEFIHLNMIPIKVYYNVNILKIDDSNVQYDFKFLFHLQSKHHSRKQ